MDFQCAPHRAAEVANLSPPRLGPSAGASERMGNCGGRNQDVKDGKAYYGPQWKVVAVPAGVTVHQMPGGSRPGASFEAKTPPAVEKMLKKKDFLAQYDDFKKEMATEGGSFMEGWKEEKCAEVVKAWGAKFNEKGLKLYFCHCVWLTQHMKEKEVTNAYSSWLEIVNMTKAPDYRCQHDHFEKKELAGMEPLKDEAKESAEETGTEPPKDEAKESAEETGTDPPKEPETEAK